MLRNLIVLPDGTELYSGSGVTNYLRSVTVSECVNSGTELTVGSVCANMLEATIISLDGSLAIAAGTEVTLYRVDNSGTRTKVGLFTAEKPTRSSANGWKLTAYDRVSLLDKDLTGWLASLDAWPYTLIDFAGMVCTQCGLILANESLPNSDFLIWKFAASGITGRKLLSWVGEICAKFCRATPDGSIEFAWYNAVSCSIGPAASNGVKYYFSGGLSYEDYQVAPIEKVQIQFSDDDVGVIWPNSADASNTYRITGNYLLLTDTAERLLPVAQEIFNVLKDVIYTPGKVSLPSSQDIHAGDIVSVTDANGKQVQMYIMSRKQSGQRDTLECTGSRSRDSVTTVNNQTLAALAGKILVLKKSVDGLFVENADMSGKVSTIGATVESISAQVSKQEQDMGILREDVAGIKVDADSISLKVQNITENGTDKLRNTFGMTIDGSMIDIDREDALLHNTLDETGMYVRSKPGDDIIMQAAAEGVETINLTARQFFNLGGRTRREIVTVDAEEWEACYWTGG